MPIANTERNVSPDDLPVVPSVLQTALAHAELAAERARYWQRRAASFFALGIVSGLGLSLVAYFLGAL